MIMTARAMHELRKKLNNQMNAISQIQLVVETFFVMFADWNWESTDVKERTIYLPTFADEQEVPWATLSHCLIPIASPYPPYKCTTVQMNQSSKVKIISELMLAKQRIWLHYFLVNE